jgi:hypothetical protein
MASGAQVRIDGVRKSYGPVAALADLDLELGPGMAVVVGLWAAGRAWPGWFPVRLGSVPGDPRWPSSRAWLVGLALGLVVAALALEARTGARFGVPGRRRAARPGPASEGRAWP